MIAVIASNHKLDPFKVAKALKVVLTSRRAVSRQVRLATPLECVDTFGYRPGTVPPIAHRVEGIPLLIDLECAESSCPLLAGGGDFGKLLKIAASALVRGHHQMPRL